MNAIPKEELKKSVKNVPGIEKLADSSGLLTILSPVAIIIAIGLLFLFVKCGKKVLDKY